VTEDARAASGRVRVRRTGGIAGMTLEGEVDLASDDDRARAVREIVDRLELAPPPVVPPMPDAFSYTIEVGGRSVTVPQHQLTPDQRALADLVLARDP
jgi:hypothetical protein